MNTCCGVDSFQGSLFFCVISMRDRMTAQRGGELVKHQGLTLRVGTVNKRKKSVRVLKLCLLIQAGDL